MHDFFLGPTGCKIFFKAERLRDFFWAKRLHDFFGAKRLRDFFWVARGCVIFFFGQHVVAGDLLSEYQLPSS